MRAAATHLGTSGDAASLMIGAFDAATGLRGRPMGVTQEGAPFIFDPFDAYQGGLVTNPNMVVAGAIGAGKSTVVKMMLDRALQRRRRVVVIDPKGEYAALAAQYGVSAWRLGRDGWCDPFDHDESSSSETALTLLTLALGRELTPRQRGDALDCFRESRRTATRPLREWSRRWEDSGREYEGVADITAALRRLVSGDLAGLFDGDGEPLSSEADLVVVDVSDHWGRSTLAAVVVAALAAGRRLATSSSVGYLVIDEAWAVLSNVTALEWLRGSWKLARARGVSHCLVIHRWSDLETVGERGSSQRAIAVGLVRDCDVAWLLRQPSDEAREMAELLRLSPLETERMLHLARGETLVRYGRARSLVRVQPDARDRRLIDTDDAMRLA